MIKALFLLFLLAASFGAGYLLGAAGTTEVKKSYSTFTNQMIAKTRGLESEVSTMRVRMKLIETRELLGAARDDVREKNFGDAEAQAAKAKERIAKAVSLASDAQRKNLLPIQSEIDAIEASIKKLDPKAAGKIEAVEQALEKAAG